MSRPYAARTKVSVGSTTTEIMRTLDRYGAEQVMFGRDGNVGMVGFQSRGRLVRMRVELPAVDARGSKTAQQRTDQEARRRWRTLAMCIKAKLESVASGVETFEEAFLPHFVLPDGDTVGQKLIPKLENVYKGKSMRLMLGAPSD